MPSPGNIESILLYRKLLNIIKAARLFVLDRRAAFLLIVIYDWVE